MIKLDSECIESWAWHTAHLVKTFIFIIVTFESSLTNLGFSLSPEYFSLSESIVYKSLKPVLYSLDGGYGWYGLVLGSIEIELLFELRSAENKKMCSTMGSQAL